MKKIRIAGPPGTGKTTFLVNIFYDCIQKYSAKDILVMSHTNAAADHIREQILNPTNIEKYQKKNKVEIFYKVMDAKRELDDNVSTIHKYCKDELKTPPDNVFEINDYTNLIALDPLFNKFTKTINFKYVQGLFKRHPFFKFYNFARDNVGSSEKHLSQYYQSLDYESRLDFKYPLHELIRLTNLYNDYKNDPNQHHRVGKVLDFTDMVEDYCEIVESPMIKVLIVDEAQDSSIIQRKAEAKISKNCDYFYKAGDPDQSIFEFSGADPDAFHKEFAQPEIELEQGYRCPRVVNEYCREIIQPIWQDYNYSRIWKPREELDQDGNPTGVVVEGELYHLLNLRNSPNLDKLIKKLKVSNESFIFTHRGGKAENFIDFLFKQGLPMKFLGDTRYPFKYPKTEIKNHREFNRFVNGDKISLAAVKKMLKQIDKEYLGPSYTEDNMDLLERGYQSMEFFIKNRYLQPVVVKVKNFQDITKPASFQMKNYIKTIVDNDRDLSEPRIAIGNIHTIKGLEFDNVVLDQRITRQEDQNTKRRLKFVACSRAKQSLFLIKSSNMMKGYSL